MYKYTDTYTYADTYTYKYTYTYTYIYNTLYIYNIHFMCVYIWQQKCSKYDEVSAEFCGHGFFGYSGTAGGSRTSWQHGHTEIGR